MLVLSASASSSPGSEVVTGGGVGAAAGFGSTGLDSAGFGSAAATVVGVGAGFSGGLASAGLTMGVGFSGGGGGVIAGAAATTSGFFGIGAGAAATAGGGAAGETVVGLGAGVEASGPVPPPFDLMCALRSATCCDSSRIVCLISASSLSRASSSSESWSEESDVPTEPESAEVASPNDEPILAVWLPKAVGLAKRVKR
jgi:hypothetical protein